MPIRFTYSIFGGIFRGIVLTAWQYTATLAAGALLVGVYIGLQFIAMKPHKNEEDIELAIANFFDYGTSARTEVGMIGIPVSDVPARRNIVNHVSNCLILYFSNIRFTLSFRAAGSASQCVSTRSSWRHFATSL